MSGKSVKSNYIYNLIYQVLTLLTPLITAPYLSRVLGADGVGTYSYIESISSYFVLFSTLGLTTFGQREISYVQDDRVKRSRIFWETNIIELVASIICIVVYVVFSLKQNTPALYLVLVFNLLSVIFNISWFFQGMEEFGKIVSRNIFFKFLNIAFIFVVIRSKDDLIWYMFGSSFFLFLNNLSYWIMVPKYIDKPVFSELHPARHIKSVISLFIPTIAIQVYAVLDKTMIGMITGNLFENGYYEQAMKISKMALTIVTSLGTVMIPRIGYLYGKGDDAMVREYMYRGYRFVWFLGVPLCLGLIMVAGNFVPWFYGDGYDKVIPLIGILSFLILAIGINNVTGMQYLIPTKRQGLFTLTVVIGACVNLVLNIFLIRSFQSYGAAIASVAAESIIAIVQIVLVRKELSPWKIIKCGWHYFVAGGIMCVVLYSVRGGLSSSIINTLILVILGAIVYFVVLLIMRDSFFIDNVKSVVNKLKRA